MTDARVAPTLWYETAEALGVSLEWIAAITEVSWSTVYAYKTGRRRTPKAWLDKVELYLAGRGALSVPSDKVS